MRSRPAFGPVAFTVLLAACSSSRQLTSIGLVPQRVTVDAQETNYPVTGTTAAELAASMRASGPGGNRFAYRWNMRWGYDAAAQRQTSLSRGSVAQNRCGIDAIRITLTFRSTIPEWRPPEGADATLVDQWATFTDAIRLHGEGHRDVALDAVREIHRRLERLETEDTNNCTLLQREARNLVDELWEDYREVDRVYHDETEGGRTQGVVWPPRGEHAEYRGGDSNP